MDIDYVQLSKTISHALRHEPWLYELELDNDGWVGVEALLGVLREEVPAWRNLIEQDLVEMIRSSSKQRHEMTAGRIRALYGHSLPGKLRREVSIPPDHLYHGTSPTIIPMIRKDGLLPMQRQYVHLSTDRETAQAVGKRKASEPVILIVKAQEAYQAGVSFYQGNEKVWLTDRVPPVFIE